MKIYLVGGAVRDKLLGLPIKERDYVVVGATVQEMLQLGYRQVGKDFPVFLHPKTHEEYALARVERKVKPGYQGFTFDASPQVSLEDDLLRRDLTINAMAESLEGELIDPYHGKRDLEKKILRHVSQAFIEDPVRILRVARFQARFKYLGFKIAEETTKLMQEMVAQGEVNALVAERVFKELERALSEKNPEQFFVVLEAAQALNILFPTISLEGKGMKALMSAAQISQDAAVRFAVLVYAETKETIRQLANHYRLPNAYRDLALITAQNYQQALNFTTLSAQEISDLFSKLDIYRRETRFHLFLQAIMAIADSLKLNFTAKPLLAAAKIVKSINVQGFIPGFRSLR